MSGEIAERLNKILATINITRVSQVAHQSFLKHTPIKTGNARRHTYLIGHNIETDYPYAERLEDGWSQQAPIGMVQPTIDDVNRYIQSNLGITLTEE